MVRNPAVSGQFYPGSRDGLLKNIESFIAPCRKKANAIGAVSPHAGYIYSGMVAAGVFNAVETRHTYIILGPNHTGMGKAFAIDSNRSWKTPLGVVNINKRLADAIIDNSQCVEYDSLPHEREHSIEVQLPFIQFFNKDFTFVPMTISYADPETYAHIGRVIAKSVDRMGMSGDVMIVASSDMTHYETAESAEAKDAKAIEAILALDAGLLVKNVSELDISMCGYAPCAIMITAARALGARLARLVKYQTSGDVTGDRKSVVGYAGIIIE